mmetsp:Transcript_7320/g.11137  ORF Transcript_7320/g.11137 Transcript_7320/m.11137 type:complete len:95 (-) Transcript_7320:202-486(-)|eukprot:CAMPEP_0178912722 /NCGR_PEP_ID=MMETSP0786-20121207/10432_1 /TAXON_ID=186022 /ORGANISM="Thalassionema frauenfeldii, Strain CCMP 1798" /LENGTH=94 /DNA_ID=CAMNT_0020585359 /DNA_START=29 /DNA_END=313 /DNA_ORIENTATION=-
MRRNQNTNNKNGGSFAAGYALQAAGVGVGIGMAAIDGGSTLANVGVEIASAAVTHSLSAAGTHQINRATNSLISYHQAGVDEAVKKFKREQGKC